MNEKIRIGVLGASGYTGADLVRLGLRPRPPGDPALIEADAGRLQAEVGFRPRHDMTTGIRAVLKAEGVLA